LLIIFVKSPTILLTRIVHVDIKTISIYVGKNLKKKKKLFNSATSSFKGTDFDGYYIAWIQFFKKYIIKADSLF